MKTIKLLVVAATLSIVLGVASAALAECSCVCVNNNKQWVCSNSWDVKAGFCGGPCYGE